MTAPNTAARVVAGALAIAGIYAYTASTPALPQAISHTGAPAAPTALAPTHQFGRVRAGQDAIAVLDTASHAPMPAVCTDAGGCGQELGDAHGVWKLSAYANMSLSGSAAVTQAVVVIHGTGRNAAGYFASMTAAAHDAGIAGHTLVVAPRFEIDQDKPAAGEATWTNASWKVGEGAVSPAGLSSFTVMDQLLATLAQKSRFPNLRRITVAGHSAGAQFTQRYAALGLAPNVLSGVTITYVVANPSSYLYFGPVRPAGDGEGFAMPSTSGCPSWNSYKYGMSGRSGYPAALTPPQAAATYATRTVTILNGGADTVDNGDMDTDCAAMLQGPNRAARGAHYLAYIQAIAPNAPHTRVLIPQVSHDAEAMFTSKLAWPALFGVRASSSSASESDTAGSRAGDTR